MKFDSSQLIAFLAATSFAAGLNVYATVATLGLLGHFDLLQLPQKLDIITHWPVISVAIALYLIELFADKVPYFDLIWNGLHTFIRVPVAAVIAWQASSTLSPGMQAASTVLGGLVALAAHTGKTAVRAGVTPSPEPFSNVFLSTVEDVAAVALTWFATTHPFVAAGIVAIFIILLALFTQFLVRRFRRRWQSMRSRSNKTST